MEKKNNDKKIICNLRNKKLIEIQHQFFNFNISTIQRQQKFTKC
jgi:hypothetical protein